MRIHLYHPQQKRITVGGQELLSNWANNAETEIWLDVSGPLSDSHAQLLREHFGLHPLALQDAARDRHPPKLESFADHSFLLFKELSAEANGIEGSTIQLAVFVGERFMVTRHSGESRSVRRLQQKLASDPGWFADGPGALAVRLGRLLVDRYLNILLSVESRLEEIETALLDRPDDSILSELVAIKSDLVRLRRTFHYQAQMLRDLRGGLLPGFSPEDDHLITDLFEQQERVQSLSDLFYSLASDLAEGYISVASHRLNQIMRILTIITVIFVPLSFLAGIYGMNFENMPELKSSFGYYMLLSVMLTIAITLVVMFRKRRWL